MGPVGFEHRVDDAGDRLGRVEGVQRAHDEMAGLGGEDRGLDRLEVAHLADEDDVGVLAQRAAERVGEAARVVADLALVDDRTSRPGAVYSIGSSTVMMWRSRCWLMWSIIEASVVLLPLPVVPVTRTRPRCSSAMRSTTGGRLSSRIVRTRGGITRSAMPTSPRWLEDVDAEAAERRGAVGEVGLAAVSRNCVCWYSSRA